MAMETILSFVFILGVPVWLAVEAIVREIRGGKTPSTVVSAARVSRARATTTVPASAR